MDAILAAASPVELQAKADAAGLTRTERDVALGLFHELTSRLELHLIDSPADGGESWPRHRFWFGARERIGAMTATLRADPDAAEPPSTAAIEFVVAERDGYAGLLAASRRQDWLTRLSGLE